MPTRGLTLGKYAPLHQGHQFVIETGISEMDEMLVIIYDAPETTPIPLAARARWIRSLYPQIRLIEAWHGPTEVGYTPELMQAHEQYVIKLLATERITHFYSSEPYGAHMSVALGAVDRRVDVTRERYPISATLVRSDPFGHRKFIPPIAYRDLITNVAILGAPSTGKTTLAKRLAAEFNTQWMPEYGREYWEQHHVERRLTPEQLCEIAAEHLRREDQLLEQSNRFLFVDTNALTTATFARYYHSTVGARLAALALQAVGRYDLVFVCDIDIPYEDTPDRSGEVLREAFQRQVIGDLHERKVPFFLLRGTIEERVAHVRRVLAGFQKFSNVMDLNLDGGHDQSIQC